MAESVAVALDDPGEADRVLAELRRPGGSSSQPIHVIVPPAPYAARSRVAHQPFVSG